MHILGPLFNVSPKSLKKWVQNSRLTLSYSDKIMKNSWTIDFGHLLIFTLEFFKKIGWDPWKQIWILLISTLGWVKNSLSKYWNRLCATPGRVNSHLFTFWFVSTCQILGGKTKYNWWFFQNNLEDGNMANCWFFLVFLNGMQTYFYWLQILSSFCIA